MSVVAERVVAPHGWLRDDVERIRSVRHLIDPKTRPDRQGECGFYARRYLRLRLNTALSCTNLRGLRGLRGTGLTVGVLTGTIIEYRVLAAP